MSGIKRKGSNRHKAYGMTAELNRKVNILYELNNFTSIQVISITQICLYFWSLLSFKSTLFISESSENSLSYAYVLVIFWESDIFFQSKQLVWFRSSVQESINIVIKVIQKQSLLQIITSPRLTPLFAYPITQQKSTNIFARKHLVNDTTHKLEMHRPKKIETFQIFRILRNKRWPLAEKLFKRVFPGVIHETKPERVV